METTDQALRAISEVGCKVRGKRETQDETVPNWKRVDEGALEGLSGSEVIGLANSGDWPANVISWIRRKQTNSTYL